MGVERFTHQRDVLTPRRRTAALTRAAKPSGSFNVIVRMGIALVQANVTRGAAPQKGGFLRLAGADFALSGAGRLGERWFPGDRRRNWWLLVAMR